MIELAPMRELCDGRSKERQFFIKCDFDARLTVAEAIMGFDIIHPRLRDRRIAAADEAISTKPGQIYGVGTRARRRAEEAPGQFNVQLLGFSRSQHMINTIILHLTAGPRFLYDDLPARASDENMSGGTRTETRIDRINAHIVVLGDGTIVYTRDVLHILNNMGGRWGIDIEFAGRYGLKPNPGFRPGSRQSPYIAAEDPKQSIDPLSPRVIESARRLIRFLSGSLPIQYIHPHGQFTADKAQTCPGPAIWLNIGDWACETLGLQSERRDGRYRSGEIHPQLRNYGYHQAI